MSLVESFKAFAECVSKGGHRYEWGACVRCGAVRGGATLLDVLAGRGSVADAVDVCSELAEIGRRAATQAVVLHVERARLISVLRRRANGGEP